MKNYYRRVTFQQLLEHRKKAQFLLQYPKYLVKSIFKFLLEIMFLTVLHLGSKQFKRIENKMVTTA